MAHGEMSGQIFISYRREDSSASAGRVYDRLNGRFPSNRIFIDVDNIAPGVDFVKAIEKSVGSCDVLIAVIGKRWLISSDEEGKRQLENSEDFVRIEIATALKRDIRVIPVLVENASMPRSGDLPDDLKSLVRRQALGLSHDRFRADSERLIGAVERALENVRTEQQRKRQEEERESEEQERLQTEQLEKVRLDAERREKERLEAERQSQPPIPVASSPPPAKSEAANPSAETPKVVYPLPPKPAESEREKPPPPSAGGAGGKSPSKQVIAFSTIAAVGPGGRRIHIPRFQSVPVATASTRADRGRDSKSTGNRHSDH
jgi:hypothetical protein